MKKLLLFSAAFAAALSLASVIIYHFVDINDYKANIIKLVEDETGYAVNINGNIRLRMLPNIALDISDVALQSEHNADSENAISVAQILIHLKLLPLLQKEVVASNLKLINPEIKFHIFADGSSNFGALPGVPDEAAQLNFLEKYSISFGNFVNNHIVNKLYPGNFEVEGAKLWFVDDRNGMDVRASNVNAKTSLDKGVNLLKISGNIKILTEIEVPFLLQGQYQFATDFYELSHLVIKLGDIETHGEASVDFRSNMPNIKVALYFEDMNLNPYGSLIDRLVVQPDGAEEKPDNVSTQPLVWDSQPIDFDLLRSFNGHFSFKANHILYKKTNIGSITTNAYLRNGKFTLSVKEAELFGGNINGEVVVDASSQITKIRHKINFEEVNLTSLLAALEQESALSGRISGGVVLATRGISQKGFVNNVDGTLSLRVDDGYIQGVDLIGVAKNEPAAFNIGKNTGRKTPFKEIAGDFDAIDGVIKTENFTFSSDLLDFNGRGRVNLPEISVNLRLAPKVKRTRDEVDILGGMRAPVLIAGSLFQPSVRLEVLALVEDLVNNPSGTENLVRQLKRDFEDIKGNMKTEEKPASGGVVKDLKEMLGGF